MRGVVKMLLRRLVIQRDSGDGRRDVELKSGEGGELRCGSFRCKTSIRRHWSSRSRRGGAGGSIPGS